MTTETNLVTADDLAQKEPAEVPRELVKGVLVRMSPAGRIHGRIVSKIDRRLGLQKSGSMLPFLLRRCGQQGVCSSVSGGHEARIAGDCKGDELLCRRTRAGGPPGGG